MTDFNTLTASELLALQAPARELLVHPWLPRQGLAMISGPRGIGKSFLVLSVAHALATGGRVGPWRADRPASVLYVDGEMPTVTVQERLAAISKQSDLSAIGDCLQFLLADQSVDGLPDLSTQSGQAQIAGAMVGFDLVILDNISTLCRSYRENEAESWAPVQEFALSRRRTGQSLLFVHHTGKGGEQRGTSKREDALDTSILLRKLEDHDPSLGARFKVEFTKNRPFYGDDARPFEMTLDPETFGWTASRASSAKDDLSRRASEMLKSGMLQKEIAAELGVSEASVSRALKHASVGSNGSLGGQVSGFTF